MKRLALTVATVALCATVLAGLPYYVPPSETVMRNLLTRRQVQRIWDEGGEIRLPKTQVRFWMYESMRYENFTNWLNTVGLTNDFARLANEFQGRALGAESVTNSLAIRNRILTTACEVCSNAVRIAQAQTADAETRAAAHSNRLVKITTFLEEKRDAAKLSTTKVIYQAILDKLAEAVE